MPKPAEDDYPGIANFAAGPPGAQAIEAALILSEVDKWRKRNEEDEKAWDIEMSDG